MLIPIKVDFGDKKYVYQRIGVNKKIVEIELPLMPMKPENIEFNIFESVLCEASKEDWDDIK